MQLLGLHTQIMPEIDEPDSDGTARGAVAVTADEPDVEAIRREPNPLIKALKVIGPGVITGASDDDPSGIATYTSTGALFGFSILWMALITLPMMASVQFISAKVGLSTGQGLAGVLKQNYPTLHRPADDPGAVRRQHDQCGRGHRRYRRRDQPAAAGADLAMVVPIGILLALLQVYGSYDLISKVFKWLALSLLAYVGAALFAHPACYGRAAGHLHPARCTSTANTSLPWWRSWARPSRPTSSSGRPPRRWRSCRTSNKPASPTRREVRGLGRERRHAALQRGHVLHHPGDCRDPVHGRQA